MVLAYLETEAQEALPEGARVLADRSYMDDLMGAAGSKKAVRIIQEEVEKVLREGAFQIKEWHSSDAEMDRSGTSETTVLGLTWQKQEDTFGVKTPTIPDFPLTHRKLLGFLARVWDPLGQLSPALVPLKVRLQSL